jgi:hypothetical protein
LKVSHVELKRTVMLKINPGFPMCFQDPRGFMLNCEWIHVERRWINVGLLGLIGINRPPKLARGHVERLSFSSSNHATWCQTPQLACVATWVRSWQREGHLRNHGVIISSSMRKHHQRFFRDSSEILPRSFRDSEIPRFYYHTFV